MIVVIKQWFVIIAMNIDHARAFEEIMYLLFNSLGWPTMLVSYILKKNPQHFNMKFTWILQDNLDFGSEHLHGNIKTYLMWNLLTLKYRRNKFFGLSERNSDRVGRCLIIIFEFYSKYL